MASNAGNDEIILLFGAREYKRILSLAMGVGWKAAWMAGGVELSPARRWMGIAGLGCLCGAGWRRPLKPRGRLLEIGRGRFGCALARQVLANFEAGGVAPVCANSKNWRKFSR
jgi:hypothetical protein